MGKLNINRNIFLEKEELLRFQKFVTDENLATKVILDNTTKWGIVRTVFDAPSPDFLIEVGTNLGTVKIGSDSKAVTASKSLIEQLAIDNIQIPTNDGTWYWVKISHQYSKVEAGECSINVNGVISGTETLFTEVLRGQNTEVPVKIKFYKEGGVTNDQIYEVVEVTDDLNITVAGSNFASETGLKYIVIGSTPISEAITPSQEEGLYWYDSCLIEFIIEEVEDTAPVTNYVEDEQFYIARVNNVSGTVTVQDKRGNQFLTFNVEGVSDKLDRDENLGDLTDDSEARNNLDVYSKAEVNAKVSAASTVVTAYSFAHSSVGSLVIRGSYNSHVVSVVGHLNITPGSDPGGGTVLFVMYLPAAGISGTLLAAANMSLIADAGISGNRMGAIQVTKVIAGPTQYVQFSVPAGVTLYGGEYYFNFTWLPI